MAGLKWDCVHLDKTFGDYQGYIEVRRSYNQKTGEIQETTKNGDRRVIPIFPEALEVLNKRKSEGKEGFVFGGNHPLDTSHFVRQLTTELKKHPRLPKVSFHGLRHTFCSFLDATGMPRRIVAEIMGHRDLNTTNRYSHVSNQTLGNEVSRWVESQKRQNSGNLEVANAFS